MRLCEMHQELKKNGFTLVRSKKHQIWEDGHGHRIILTTTKPSVRCIRYMKKQIKRMKNGELDKLPTCGS